MKNVFYLMAAIIFFNCSNERSALPIANEFQYNQGDQICIATGAIKQIYTLQENVKHGQFAAFASRPNGPNQIVDIESVIDFSECYGGL